MTKKKHDPLWEVVDEKIALQGQEPDVDVPCPHCGVLVHLGILAKAGERYACGLCGGVSEVAEGAGGPSLRRVPGAPRAQRLRDEPSCRSSSG
ncbi:MAG: hypothetical protein JXA87_13455 [Thermoleophilia bacterium]|nr:hypothetical protein [Thermoleophilia bacterium]